MLKRVPNKKTANFPHVEAGGRHIYHYTWSNAEVPITNMPGGRRIYHYTWSNAEV